MFFARIIPVAAFFFATFTWGQQAILVPDARPSTPPIADTFHFVSDGPIGPGWSRPDEIARKYFHDDLTPLFERTLTLKEDVPSRTTLRWIFTGPHAGFTVEWSGSKVRIIERYYDSMGLYAGGNYPERVISDISQPYIGHARSLTVIADSHLAVRVLVNGTQLLQSELLFDVTRHQLMYAAPRSDHDIVEGALLKPEIKSATVTIHTDEAHQTMLGFGGSPSIPAYMQLSEEGKRRYWQILKHYNLLLSREYPMGSELKPDLSNLDQLADATPHYYGDNFPNGEVSSFDYSKHILDLGGDVIYEMWALPSWATEPYSGPRILDAWNKPVKIAAKPDEYARIVVTYCKLAKARTGAAPLIVGIQNEVEQPPEVFDAMVKTLRKALDEAGFASTKIHMADASFMFYGIDRAKSLRKDAAAWKGIDYTAAHEYDFQEFMANPDQYDARMKQMHEASAGKEFMATEICFNDAHYQEPSYRIAFSAAQLYHKNLTELDAVALMYCWLLLDVEQPTFGGSRSLMVPDRTQGNMPVASSFELRVLGAFSRYIHKGMTRHTASSDDANVLVTEFSGHEESTLVLINRGTTALHVRLPDRPWKELERTSFASDNAPESDTATIREALIQPGEIVTVSTGKAN